MKKILFFIVACCLSFSMISCSSDGDITASASDKATLNVYVSGDILATELADKYADATIAMKAKYPNVTIKYITKEEYGLSSDADFNSRIADEILEDKGPDLYIFTAAAEKAPLGDIQKMVQTGAFTDLNGLMESDSTFKPEYFLEPALNACEFSGRQYFMPITVATPIYLTTQKIIRETKVDLNKCKTTNGLLSEFDRYLNNRPKTDTRSVFNLMYSGLQELALYWDYSDLTVSFDAEQSTTFFSCYKSIVNQSDGASDKKIIDNLGDYPFLQANELLNGKDTPVLLPTYNNEGKIQTEIADYAGISELSENKKIAYDFMMIIAKGGDLYTSANGEMEYKGKEISGGEFTYGTMSSYRPMALNYWRDYVIYDAEGKANEVIPQKYMEQVDEIYTNIEVCTLHSEGNRIIQEKMQPFFDGEMSVEECLIEAKTALESYMSEKE